MFCASIHSDLVKLVDDVLRSMAGDGSIVLSRVLHNCLIFVRYPRISVQRSDEIEAALALLELGMPERSPLTQREVPQRASSQERTRESPGFVYQEAAPGQRKRPVICKYLIDNNQICNKRLSDKSTYNRHLTTHLNHFKHWCYVCGQRHKAR